MQPKRIALAVKEAAEDKKAQDVTILDVAKQTSVAHYFVIISGTSDRHVRAVAQNIADELKKRGERCLHLEGMQAGNWVLLDFGAVIVHVFYRETRDFYGLERLWGEAKRIEVK